MTETRGTGKYERLLARCKDVPPITAAIAHPCDDVSLGAVVEAARAGILQPIIVGPADRIRRAAKDLRLDVDAYQIEVDEKKELLPPPGLIRKMEPQPKDVEKGYVALEVSSDGEFLGASEVKFTGERKLADLQVGKSVKIALPVLKPHGVDRHTGKIAAAKAETIDLGVDGKPTGLRPIDPQRDLPAGKLSVPAAMTGLYGLDAMPRLEARLRARSG